MTYTYNITSQGQVTIPKRIRDMLQLTDKVSFVETAGGKIEVVAPRKPRTIEEIRALLAVPAGTDTYSENDLMIGKMLSEKYHVR